MASKNSYIYEFSDNIKRVSLITGLSIIIIIIVFFLPIINSIIVMLGKIAALTLLSYAFFINVTTTNKIMTNFTNLFVDPSKSNVRDIMILSYIFSFSIMVLFAIIVHSFFR